jgi:PAS domain S-box-containing protein
MSSKGSKSQEPISHQDLLDENRALKDEVQSLRARLEEAEELKRAISEGDLDALVIPGPEGELIFTLDSADRAYRFLVETMNEGTATLGYDGTILYCNHHLAELLKMPPQVIVGTSIYRFIAPENATTFKALLELKTGKGEINLLAEGGIFVPVYLSISSLQVEGSPNAWCLVVTDLTEQKKNEEILASEHLTRLIIEQTAETIIVCDMSGRIIRFSNAISKICRCDPTFQKFEDLIDLRFSEGADAGKSILPVSFALKGSAILGVEAIFEQKDCQKYYLLLNSGSLKNDDSEIIGCVVTLTDITERKKTEEELHQAYSRLRTLFDHRIDGIGIVIANADGDVLEANDVSSSNSRVNFPTWNTCRNFMIQY